MTQIELRQELVAHARRLVDLRVVASNAVAINEFAGTVTNRFTGELLHYESGVVTQLAWWPWPARIRT